MANYYSTTQAQTIDRDNRQMALAGFPMSGELESIRDEIGTGAIGIQSNAADIDSLALGGGAFSVDADTTTGLTFGYSAGRINTGVSVVSVSAGTIALSASTTNFVECDRAGTVSANTSGFTAGRCPLYTIVTGGSAIATVTVSKALLFLLGNGAVTGAMLTAAASTKEEAFALGAVSATTALIVIAPDVASSVSKLSIANSAAVSKDDANYYTFTLVNKTSSTSITAATNFNTTKSTGGSSLAAYGRFDVSLNSANIACNAGDVLELTFTAAGSPTTMTELAARIGFSFSA